MRAPVVFGMVVALALGARAAAAQAEVRGTVLSRSDSAPVVAADVSTQDGRLRTRTDDRGRFRLGAVPGDTLRIRALGFGEGRVVATRDDLVIRLELVPVMLGELTTTVGQRVIRTGDTPASVTVVDRAEIDATAAISANQLLRQLPGLQELPASPSRTTIAIRGLDDARVLVLVDGEPVAGSLIQNRDIGRLSTIAAERIEVTKGPSSVEFGSDALGGVINLVTAAPAQRLTVEATGRAGDIGRRESTLGVTGTTGRLGFRVDGGVRQTEQVTGVSSTAQDQALDRVYDLRTDLRYAASERLALRLDVQASQQRQRWPTGGGFNGFIDDHTLQGFAEGQLEALGGSFRLRAFGQAYDYKYRQAQALIPIAGPGDPQQERYGRLLFAHTRVAGTHTLDGGVQFSARSIESPGKVEGDRASDQLIEVFGRDSWRLGTVLVTGGARYTNSSLWGGAATPTIGLAWQPTPAWRFRTNVARGFRGPAFKELRYTFSNPSGGYTVIGNPNLVPESSWSSSVGLTWAPVRALAIDVEGYRNAIRNLIDNRFVGTNDAGFMVYQALNVARARTEGIETNVRYATGTFEASVGYDYLRARDLETGLALPQRATHTARGRLSRLWTVLGGVNTDVTARYTGVAARGTGTDANDNPILTGRQAPFFSLDGQLRVAVNAFSELSVGVNNVLDRRPEGWSGLIQRQVFAGLKLRWSPGS